MPAAILTSPSPPAATAPAETPKEPSAREVVQSIKDEYEQNIAQVHKAFGPVIAQSAADVEAARAEEARVQQQVVAPAAERYATPRPQPPIPQFSPQPPVRDISPRPFMDNPQAKDTLGNVVSLLGTMAQMAMAGRAPVAALNAFSGAMTGWAEGDRVRAQRQWSEYLATVDKINAENITAQRAWEDSFKEYGASELAARARYVVALDQAGLKERATTAAQQGLKDYFQMEQHYISQYEKLRDFTLNANKYLLDHELKQSIQAQNYAFKLDAADRMRQELDVHRQSLGIQQERADIERRKVSLMEQAQQTAADPETLDWLAARVRGGEDISQVVRGFGQHAGKTMMEIQKRAMQQAKDAGDDASSITLSRRFLQANTSALRSLTVEETRFKSYLTTFEQTVANSRRLAAKLEKSGMPVWDRKLLWLEAKVNGNEDANNLLGQMEILAREADRVLARGRGVGSERSREEARQLMDPGLTQKQFYSLIDNVLSPDALYAAMGFDVQKKELLQAIQNPTQAPAKAMQAPGQQTPGAMVPPRPGMVRVKRKSDGITGWLDQKDLGDLYELVQ